MPSAVPHVQAGVLSDFRRVVRQKGGDPDVLFARVGLTTSDLADPDKAIPLASVLQLFELAAETCRDPCFGLHYAEVFPIGGTGLLGQLLYSAPTVRDALLALSRYIRIHVDNIVVFEETGGIGRLTWEFPVGLGSDHFQYSMFGMAAFLMRLRSAVGAAWRAPAVNVAAPRPRDTSEYERVLGTSVRFDERRNMLVFDATMLAQQIPQKVDRLFETLKSAGERELAEVERRTDIVASVRHEIAQTFGTDAPFDLEALASKLSMSSRSLQWRLGQHEATYERLLTEVRREVAERMLREGRTPMTEIAGHLRFSELSAFTRAAHRWFGMSPTEYRRKLRQSGDTGG